MADMINPPSFENVSGKMDKPKHDNISENDISSLF